MIHYRNPKVVVGCLAEWDGRVLLCRRAIEPRRGLWTVPAGFLECGESTRAGAARETLEEALAHVEVGPLYAMFDLPHIDQIYMLYRGRLLDGSHGAGEESLECGLFLQHEIPFDSLAFPVIRESLALYFADRERGGFPLRCGEIVRNGPDMTHFQMLLHQDAPAIPGS